MTCFLRVQLAGRDARPGDMVLVNIDHVARIHPTWPQGCSIVMDDDTTSLHVKHSFEDIQMRLVATGGRVVVKTMPELEHQVDVAYEATRADLLP